MTIKELKNTFTEKELSIFPGDLKLRYEMFGPIFQNLFENKVVYYEKIFGIVKLEDVIISPDRFQAVAVPYRCIIRKKVFDNYFFKKRNWIFSAKWDSIRLIDNSFNAPYANWTIWTDPELVKKIEELVNNKYFDDALQLTLYSV